MTLRTAACPSPFLFFFNDPATTEIYTLSLHDALPISSPEERARRRLAERGGGGGGEAEVRREAELLADSRSEEHTSELQSQSNLVCRLLLEKKKKTLTREQRDCVRVHHAHTLARHGRT